MPKFGVKTNQKKNIDEKQIDKKRISFFSSMSLPTQTKLFLKKENNFKSAHQVKIISFSYNDAN